MALREVYQQQVRLLIRTIPFVAEEKSFALKGGTAINLFVRDMPRLSVDIDLTYMPIEERTTSLANIDAAMRRIAERIRKGIPGSRVALSILQKENIVSKLVVRTGDAQIKIEVTPVLRGCVFDPVVKSVSAAVEEGYGFAEMQVVSFADLYAGKIVAALDRQHPRDLFDVRDLIANEGIDDQLRQAFIVYTLSHHRTMAEVLAPTRKNIASEFERHFDGMTAEPVSLDELLKAREAIIEIMIGQMPKAHRRFLLSVKAGAPEWELLDVPGASGLPAIRWKLENLDKLERGKRDELLKVLQAAIGTQNTRGEGGHD